MRNVVTTNHNLKAANMANKVMIIQKQPKTKKQFTLEENSVDLYFNEIKSLQKLTAEDEIVLAARIKAGDKAAVNILVEANLKFVVAVCKNYRNQGMSFGDLIGEGNLGLIKAAQRYDGNSGFRFISYAVWWIRQGILIALAGQSRFLGISPSRIGTIRQVGKATRNLTQKLGREPDGGELAEHLGLTDQLVTECSMLTLAPKSLSHSTADDGPNLEENLQDRTGDTSDRTANAYLLRKKMAVVLDQMDGRRAQILRMSYGIGSGAIYSLKDIADKLNLSKERVRQIRTASIGMLRHPIKMKMLGI